MREKNFQTIFMIFIVVIAGLSYLTYTLYIESNEQQTLIISQLKLLENKSKIIDILSYKIQNLKSDITSKESTINILSNRLGLTQSELETLKPVVKSYYTVGVRGDGRGVVIPLEVKIVNGTGSVSVNIKNVDLQSGAQNSIRTATYVASTYTKKDLSKKDITVTFVNELDEIVSVDGPSAGAVITTTIIAAIENKTLSNKILMTGTIELGGSIGRVGSVKEKATAARDAGATLFLVPSGQGLRVNGIEIGEVKTVSEVINLVVV